MKPLQIPRRYVEDVMTAAAGLPAGRWQDITLDSTVKVPAKRRPPSDTAVISIHAVRALIRLLEGEPVRFIGRNGANPALVITVTTGGQPENIVYRFAGQIVTDYKISQSHATATLFAAKHLLAGDTDLVAAYQAVLDGIKTKLPQVELDQRLITASDELMLALSADASIPNLSWWSEARASVGEIDEAADAAPLDLMPLFTDATMFAKYAAAGSRTPFDIIRKRLPGQDRGEHFLELAFETRIVATRFFANGVASPPPRSAPQPGHDGHVGAARHRAGAKGGVDGGVRVERSGTRGG